MQPRLYKYARFFKLNLINFNKFFELTLFLCFFYRIYRMSECCVWMSLHNFWWSPVTSFRFISSGLKSHFGSFRSNEMCVRRLNILCCWYCFALLRLPPPSFSSSQWCNYRKIWIHFEWALHLLQCTWGECKREYSEKLRNFFGFINAKIECIEREEWYWKRCTSARIESGKEGIKQIQNWSRAKSKWFKIRRQYAARTYWLCTLGVLRLCLQAVWSERKKWILFSLFSRYVCRNMFFFHWMRFQVIDRLHIFYFFITNNVLFILLSFR